MCGSSVRGHGPGHPDPWPLAPEPSSAGYDDRRAPADAVVEIEHVRIVHADAAVGDEAADRAWVVGAVNGVFPAAAERHGGGSHGIARASTRDHVRQRRLVALDL